MAEKIRLTGTKHLKELFPELPRTNRFKRAIDQLFAHYNPEIYITIADRWNCFRSTSGKGYKTKISGAAGSMLLQRTRIDSCHMSREVIEQNPDDYRDVNFDSKSGYYMDGKMIPAVFATFERTDRVSFSQIALILGKLLKDDAIFVKECNKCDGTGFIPAFAHISEGVCFQCMGIGKWIEVQNIQK